MSDIDKQISDLARGIRDAMGSALFDVGNLVVATAEPFVPIYTGALRRSAKVSVDKQNLTAKISYGGTGVDYAGPQYGPPYSADFAKRHLTRGTTLTPLTNVIVPSERKGRARGKNARYSQAYKKVVDTGVLTVFSEGAQWVEKAIDTKDFERKTLSIIRRTFQ